MDTYRISRGDTLGELAKRFEVPIELLAEANGIKNINKIRENDLLSIPDLDPTPIAEAPPEVKPVPVKEIGRTDPYTVDVEFVPPPATPPATESKPTTTSPSAPKQAEAWGPGYSKSYPALTGEPGSTERLGSVFEQMKYGDFWMDFLDKALPTAIQGAAPGTGTALLKAASSLRQLAKDTEFSKLPRSDDPMAKWLFKNMKYFDRTDDPNYQFKDPMSERRMDAVGNRPLAMEGPKSKAFPEPGPEAMDFIREIVRGFSPGTSTEATIMTDVNFASKSIQETMTEGVEQTRTTTVPKSSTAVSNVSKTTPSERPSKSTVEKGFLSLLSSAEELGVGGKALTLYNDVVQRGRKEPISEADFDPEEQAGLKGLVQKHAAEHNTKSGHIDYKDYAKYGGVDKNMLGGFDYEIDKNGEIVITDKWDFNDLSDGQKWGEDNPIVQVMAAAFAPGTLASKIGRDQIPAGKGVPVKIRIK